MPKFHDPAFEELELSELYSKVEQMKANGHYFTQICATTEDYGVELLYAFAHPNRPTAGLDGLLVQVPTGACVPSITALYPAAFVFENETHDLFGVKFTDISIDFEGSFYLVSQKYPMNPKAAEAEEAAAAQAENDAPTEATAADEPEATPEPVSAVEGEEVTHG